MVTKKLFFFGFFLALFVALPSVSFAQFGFPDPSPDPPSGGGAGGATAGCEGGPGGVCIPTGTGLPAGTGTGTEAVFTILTNVMLWLLGIFGILALIAFVVAGIMYLFSGGEETKATNAKKAMIFAIIGVIVGLSGVLIISAIDYFLTGGFF